MDNNYKYALNETEMISLMYNAIQKDIKNDNKKGDKQ